jgi:glycyl-tRNA synthetase (class II)
MGCFAWLGGALDAITNLCKRRGFAFPSSEIYGSIGTAYDLGPLGAQLKKNLQDRWWRDFVERRKECMGLETATILNPRGMSPSNRRYVPADTTGVASRL